MVLAAPFDRISVEPDKMSGQPRVRGLRITVCRVLELLAAYPTRQQFLTEYPNLEDEDLRQALHYAAAAARQNSRVRVIRCMVGPETM